jgi:hypothetical protein
VARRPPAAANRSDEGLNDARAQNQRSPARIWRVGLRVDAKLARCREVLGVEDT